MISVLILAIVFVNLVIYSILKLKEIKKIGQYYDHQVRRDEEFQKQVLQLFEWHQNTAAYQIKISQEIVTLLMRLDPNSKPTVKITEIEDLTVEKKKRGRPKKEEKKP